MQIAIDYQFCTHGNFLQYLCDVFVIPTITFHNPFDKLGTAHARLASSKTKFVLGHYHGNVINCSHVINIEPSVDDALKIMAIRLHKMRQAHYFLKHQMPRKFLYPGIRAFYFQWHAFFDYNLLVNELQRLCDFLSVPRFEACQNFNLIYQEFLTLHDYVFHLDDKTTPLGKIASQIQLLSRVDEETGSTVFWAYNRDQIESLCTEYIDRVNRGLTESDLFYVPWAKLN